MVDAHVAASDDELRSVSPDNTNKNNNQEESIEVKQDTSTDAVESGLPKFKVEKYSALRMMAFDEPLQVLQVSNPQGSSPAIFTDPTAELCTQEVYRRMKRDLGGSLLKKTDAAMRLWVNLHSEVDSFRITAHYHGKSGAG